MIDMPSSPTAKAIVSPDLSSRRAIGAMIPDQYSEADVEQLVQTITDQIMAQLAALARSGIARVVVVPKVIMIGPDKERLKDLVSSSLTGSWWRFMGAILVRNPNGNIATKKLSAATPQPKRSEPNVIPSLAKEGKARSAGVVRSMPRSTLTDIREAHRLIRFASRISVRMLRDVDQHHPRLRLRRSLPSSAEEGNNARKKQEITTL